MKSFTHFVWPLTTALACCLCALAPTSAATLEETTSRLRQFAYGGDASALAEVENLVGAATAEASGSEARADLALSLAAILEADASYEAKQFVCRQLAVIGTARQVPVLVKLLVDERMSDMARYALVQIPDPSATQSLRDALGHAAGKTRIGIINSLGHRRDSNAVEALGALLDSADADAALASASALGRIGGTEAADRLKRALDQASGGRRFAITDALLGCAERHLAQGKTAEAEGIYRALFAASEAPWTRSAALRGLVASSKEGAQLAAGALRETDPILIRAAIGCIQSVPGAEATRGFAAELANLPSHLQAMLLNALAERGDSAALPAVKVAAGSAEPAAKTAAVQALGKLGDRSVVDLLVGIVNQAGPESAAALNSLQILRAEGVDGAIAGRLDQAPSRPRTQLIDVLAERHATSAAPVLERLLGNSDASTAVAAAKALGEVAEPSALPVLLKVLKATEAEPLREAVEDAVIAVSRRIPSPGEQSDAVLRSLQQETSPQGKGSLLRVVGGIGSPKGLEAVQSALNDSSDAVRDAAVRALADWPNPPAIQPLRSVFGKTSNDTHRALALRGLVRLADPSVHQVPADQTLEIYQELMDQLRGPDEIRLALSGLAGVNDARALRLIEPHLSNDATKEEAAAATAKIAAAMIASDPAAARESSERVLALSSNPAIRKQAGDVLQELQKTEDFVTEWELAGPFSQAGKSAADLFDVAFPPESTDASSVQWKKITAPGSGQQPAIIDLMGALGGSDRVAYLRTWVFSDQKQPAQLELGSDDGIKAWLNGKVVHANNIDRGLAPGQDKAPIVFNKGWNQLLLKVTQGGGGWAACARLRNPDGGKLTGVRVDSAHREAGVASGSR